MGIEGWGGRRRKMRPAELGAASYPETQDGRNLLRFLPPGRASGRGPYPAAGERSTARKQRLVCPRHAKKKRFMPDLRHSTTSARLGNKLIASALTRRIREDAGVRNAVKSEKPREKLHQVVGFGKTVLKRLPPPCEVKTDAGGDYVHPDSRVGHRRSRSRRKDGDEVRGPPGFTSSPLGNLEWANREGEPRAVRGDEVARGDPRDPRARRRGGRGGDPAARRSSAWDGKPAPVAVARRTAG